MLDMRAINIISVTLILMVVYATKVLCQTQMPWSYPSSIEFHAENSNGARGYVDPCQHEINDEYRSNYSIAIDLYIEGEEMRAEMLEEWVNLASGHFMYDSDGITLTMDLCIENVVYLKPSEVDMQGAELVEDGWYPEVEYKRASDMIDNVAGNQSQKTLPIFVIDTRLLGYSSIGGAGRTGRGVFVSRDLVEGKVTGRRPDVVLTHLIASFIGLPPIWFDEGKCGDGIDDTPIQDGINFGWRSKVKHVSLKGKQVWQELTTNYMGNLTDSLRGQWTNGQIRRLNALLQHPMNDEITNGSGCGEVDQASLHVATDHSKLELSVEPNPVRTDAHFELVGGSSDNIAGREERLRLLLWSHTHRNWKLLY